MTITERVRGRIFHQTEMFERLSEGIILRVDADDVGPFRDTEFSHALVDLSLGEYLSIAIHQLCHAILYGFPHAFLRKRSSPWKKEETLLFCL